MVISYQSLITSHINIYPPVSHHLWRKNGDLEEGNSKYWDTWGGMTQLEIVPGYGESASALKSFGRQHYSHGQAQNINTDCGKLIRLLPTFCFPFVFTLYQRCVSYCPSSYSAGRGWTLGLLSKNQVWIKWGNSSMRTLSLFQQLSLVCDLWSVSCKSWTSFTSLDSQNPFSWDNAERCSDILMFSNNNGAREYNRVAEIHTSAEYDDAGW